MPLRSVIAVALVAAIVSFSLSGSDPASAVTATQVSSIKAEANWILQAQRSDGAIANYTDQTAVWPYLSSFAAIGLARTSAVTGDNTYVARAWKWLSWYGAHQDKNGFVTDYRIVNGQLVSTGDMDSTDAYAGVFLMAAREAWRVSQNRTKLKALAPAITGAVHAIEATQDVDGLTWAKPAWHVKYLMDEAEAWGGLVAANDLAVALKDSALATRATADANRVKTGIDSLWNPVANSYDWAKHDNGARIATDWTNLYPDALEQAWPVAFGVVGGTRAASLMATFTTTHPTWDQPATVDVISGTSQPTGYRTPAGWGVAALGTVDSAVASGQRILDGARAVSRAWPYTPGDAGQVIVLLSGGWNPTG